MEWNPPPGTNGWKVLKTEERLQVLHDLYEHHDYSAVIRGTKDILKHAPKNRSAKKLKKMARMKVLNTDMRVALTTLTLALFVMTGALTFMSNKLLGEMKNKDFQVNSLIDEVGELREENMLLYQKFTGGETVLNMVAETVLELEGKVNDVHDEEVFGLQKQLTEAQDRILLQSEAVESLVDAGVSYEPMVAEDETLDILILGTHGSLTDTIMLASVNPELESVTLLSIPRDLAVNGRRINEFYYRYGMEALRDQIYEITGLYPEQYAVVDLAAFEQIVNILGGIDVYVEKDLYDTRYPGPNFTYETFSVTAGHHHFDGVTALKYARSRKSTNDFDRAKRQQQIVEAVRQRIEDLDLLSNSDELIGIFNTVYSSVDTDIDLLSFLSYLKQYREFGIEQGHVLSTSNYLYSTYNVSGAYVLLPNAGDYSEIWEYVAGVVLD
jgi:LCP family protein required for cell wall assembly